MTQVERRRRLRRRRARVWTVYVIAGAGLVKIGKTARGTRHRLKDLQFASPVPLRLVGTIPQAGLLELALHRAFRNYRLHGEWFGRPVHDFFVRETRKGKTVRQIAASVLADRQAWRQPT